jgi:hypothetical protein
MNKKLLLPLGLVAFLGIAATTYTITQLTANTSPGDGTILEVYDPSASPKSGKYLLTNLMTRTGSFYVLTNIYSLPKAVSWSGAVTLDFSSNGDLWATLGGSVTLSSSGLTSSNGVTVRIDNPQSTNCNVILPSGWRFVSGTITNILAASKVGVLSAKSYSGSDTNVICTWASE